MTDFVGIDVLGIPELVKFLDGLPDAAQDQVATDVSKYLIDVLRINPAQKYVTRKQAYGRTFQTRKQQRWFFWALGTGAIDVPYHRTQQQARGWKTLGEGKNIIIVNEAPGIAFTRGDDTRSRHERLVGWRTTTEVIKERAGRIMEIAEAAVARAIKRLEAK